MKKTYLLLIALISSFANAQYCQPTFQYGTDGNMITRTIFGSIDNTSPFQSGTTPVYESFTAQSTQITAGETYPISVKGPSSTFESDVMVYIDFNQNGNFDDAGEGFFLGRLAAANPANALTLAGNITIPVSALNGTTTMRIMKNTNTDSFSNPQAPNSITGSCAALRAGQAEDYTVVIIAATPLCQSTDPGNSTGDTSCITFNYKGETVEYTTVRAADGNIWLQQNLGSTHVANTSNDADAYGDLFQWGRWDDGHQSRTSPTSSTTLEPNNPMGLQGGSVSFYTTQPEWWNTSAAATDKWSAESPQQVSDTNGCDPCKALGQGWRLPTAAEWQSVIDNEVITNIATAFSSSLKLTIAGMRSSSGSISNAGVRGYYWSSTVSDNTDFAKYLYYSNFIVNTNAGGFREQGGSIRCMKSMAPPTPTSLNITTQNNIPAVINTNAGTLQLIAAVLPQSVNQNVHWTIQSGGEFASIDQNGLVTAIANGTITVQAVSLEDNAIFNTIQVTISNQIVAAQSLIVSVQDNAQPKILVNEGTLQLLAAVLPAEASQDVIWSIASGNELASVNESGLVTAIANGTVTIKATSATFDTIFDEIEVHINNQNPASASPYCDVTAEYDVEPITLVQFAGIDNPTSEIVNNTPAYEDFTQQMGEVLKGETYTLTVKGNTVGLHEHDIRVFIDWNQNEMFDMATEYYATSITNTDGIDSVEATLDIEVPQTALLGNTRMRIIKDLWTAYEEGEFDGCTDAYYGQTEDYTLTITENTMNIPNFNTNSFTVYPNPTVDNITVEANATVETIRVYNIEGQLIATGKDNQVNLSKAATGLYIIKVEFVNGSSVMQKIVKQ